MTEYLFYELDTSVRPSIELKNAIDLAIDFSRKRKSNKADVIG